MKKKTNIAHPLQNRTGSSQGGRSKEALASTYAPIDGKSLGDRLHLIGQFAKLVNFYDVAKDLGGSEFQNADNWTDFFENSLPFQLAKLGKTSTDNLRVEFSLLLKALKENPSVQTLEVLLSFVYEKLILPVDALYATVVEAENSFSTSLLAIVKSSYQDPLKKFILLYNASATFLCVPKKKFDQFLRPPWQLPVGDIYGLDLCIQQVKKGKKEGYLLAGETAASLLDTLLSSTEEIINVAPDFIQESIYPLEESQQEQHQPHLALLFTFLELFMHLQGDINKLGKKHLDFFYKNVLRCIPKDAEPDTAHIIFEIAKHLEDGYSLSEGLLLKDGKDANKQEIQFGLDHELVLDKAKIMELKTLSVYPVKDNDDNQYVEGVYIAPEANSLDGKGEKFKEDQNNWATLGDKYSKQIQEGNTIPDEHPKARLGFVLASPVLLLQEGTRKITISLDCKKMVEDVVFTYAEIVTFFEKVKNLKVFVLTQELVDNCLQELSDPAKEHIISILSNESPYTIGDDIKDFLFQADPVSCVPIFEPEDRVIICECLEEYATSMGSSIFDISFSGEEGWVIPKPGKIIMMELTAVDEDADELPDKINLKIVIELDDDDPSVVFFDGEVLEENLPLEPPQYPVVKIELNREVKEKRLVFNCDQLDEPEIDISNEDDCCMKNEPVSDENIRISMYHYFRELTLQDATIDVEVCGVKNLIVQNDDNLQDVNKPIMPFGPRPKVGATIETNSFVDGGANFYIGSKEIFCKNWQKFWINTVWKDKPLNLEDHYEFYHNDVDFEDGNEKIENDSFKFRVSILHEGSWKSDFIHHPPDDVDHDPPHYRLFNLFVSEDEEDNPCENIGNQATFFHGISKPFTQELTYVPKSMPLEPLQPVGITTRKGFTRLTLAGVSFQHDRYTFVLAKQMMALVGLLDPLSVIAVQNNLLKSEILSGRAKKDIKKIQENLQTLIDNIGPAQAQFIPVLSTLTILVGSLAPNAASVNTARGLIATLITRIGGITDDTTILGQLHIVVEQANNIQELLSDKSGEDPIPDDDVDSIEDGSVLSTYGLQRIVFDLDRRIVEIKNELKPNPDLGIPKEPYTPLIKSLSIDYKATAAIDDMEIIHLYPFENTSKQENIEENPNLFPHFVDEGSLYIGVENITLGGQLSILFQLAEATADSEQNRAKINWHYLSHNSWKPLLPDFDVIDDATDGLTVSGIVTIAVPGDINKVGNTVMPDHLYWLKTSALANVKAVAETIGIHTQAARASARFSDLNDKERLNVPLEAGSIAKLVDSDFNVKKVEQLYDSFGGRRPEASGHFYVRVSEQLKHKGRGIMIMDYEKIILEAFPEIYKVKCISHTMGLPANDYQRDLEIAPGYLVIAVIPDLTKLKSGNLLTPKAPISLLEKIGDHIRKRISPFARIKVMNPRYEPIDVNIKVRFYRGKNDTFYSKKLKDEISQFLAPWFLGDSEKLAFGQEVLFSDLVGFVEQRDYVDFIINLEFKGKCQQNGAAIKPLTARSILTGGEICVIIGKEMCLPVNVESQPGSYQVE